VDFDLRPGDEVAGHRLERIIGRGGMSVVYLAEHLRLGRRVAFKVLAPQFAEDPGFRQRFMRESRTAAALDHPNIVTVYDAGEFDGLLYISMRYVEGSDLSRVLSEDGAIERWRTLTIVSQMGSALDAAHAEGLVHRDVKPGNILLSQPGTPLERAFLSDFGVTKRMTTSEALTRTGQFVGTVDYVAPEQILGGSVDGRTDVYSLGCVLYQCLSGQIPFPRPTDVATIYAHLHDKTPVLPEAAFPGMDPVITRALAKEKEDRYPSCTALVEAARSNLREGAETEVRAAPTGISEETTEMPALRQPPWRRTGWILAAAIAIAVVAAIAIALAGREPGTVGATSPSSPSLPTTTTTIPSGAPFDPARLHWNKENRSTFAQATGEVAFTDAISRGRDVIAVGHADDRDEDAVVWTKVAGLWRRHYVAGRDLPGDQKLDGIASVGTNRLVTVGYDSGHAVGWYSDDGGASWAAVTGLDGGTDAKAVVEAPDGTIWALGPGAVWTSPDGASWSFAPSSAFPSDAYAWNAIVYGDGVVAVGQGTGPSGSADAAVWLLRDGAWARIDPPTFDVPGRQYLRDVSVDPVTDRLVAVGTDPDLGDAVVWTSDDGATWQRTASLPGSRYQGLSSVFFMPGTPGSFIAGGWNGGSEAQKDAAIWYSRDGIEWLLERGRTETYDLGDRGAQEIRALVPFGSGGIVAYAFGVQGVGKAGQPRLWNGIIQAS
jgi:serine/threonine protein kinase